MNSKTLPRLLLCAFAILLCTSCSVITDFQPIDPQSATLTALVTPTSIQPTLDLKGNEVLEDDSCQVFYGPIISTFENAEDGGIFAWADGQDYLAYVVPENRYWAWFSGDAEVLNFEEDSPYPLKMDTSGLKVFGDFAFNPNATRLAFVVFRPSEKVYSIMVSTLSSGLQMTIDLFTDTAAVTDEYSSGKSVISWENNNEINVATSCGIDCERVYLIDTVSGSTRLLDEVRKKGHNGRVFPQNVKEYDERDYPAMTNPNWSPDGAYVFYTDAQDKTWILNDQTKQQFELPISGESIWQTAWSYDHRFIAIRFRENLAVYQLKCGE